MNNWICKCVDCFLCMVAGISLGSSCWCSGKVSVDAIGGASLTSDCNFEQQGQTVYRVRWKGYTSDDDTWEPEAHLEDCREVLLHFKKKTTESKAKPAKKEKETQKLNLSTDIFDAESEGDWRPDSEDEIPVRKKKKKVREIRDDDDSDGVKKKKSKSVKSKETITSDDELSDDLTELTSGKESKSKKRNLEFLEDTASTKKRKKEERKKVKKDTDDIKKKHKDVSKEKKKRKKEKESDTILESKQSSDDSDTGTADHVMDVQDKTEEEKVETKTETKTEKALEETSEVEETASKQEPVVANAEEEVPDVKEKEKKKKDKKIEQQEQISLPKNKEESLDKKNLKKDSHNKKQKHQEKSTVSGDTDKGSNVAAKVQKTPKVSVEETAPKFAAIADEDSAKKSKKPNETDSVNRPSVKEMESPISAAKEKGLSKLSEDGKGKEKTPSGPASSSLFEKFSVESEGDKGGQKTAENSSSLAEKGALEKVDDTKVTPKVQDKVAKTEVPKEIPAKKKDSEKDEKGKKEQKIEKKELKIESARDLKGIFGAFRKHPEDHSRQLQKNEKTEDVPNFRYTPESKAKENKPVLKERRDTRDDDSWLYGPSEVTHVVQDTVSHTEENPDAKQQVLSLGLDLQLEWMKLESFQKHIDGEDEVLSTTETISNSALREAVKNGDYLSVKIALNSKEEYNLDQEDSSGMTLVMLAAASGQDDILRLLIKKGAKLNARQKTGTTALIHAAEKNFLTTVAILLEAGALVNAQQISGETALMKACKRGNADIVRLMLEYGADCSILSKHQNSALHYAKQSNNVMLYDLLRNHMDTLSRVAEDTIRDYFEARLTILEPVFPIACHRLCEGPDFSMDFTYKPPQNAPEGSGMLLFIFHANFFSGSEIVARLCGPCSVQAVILNDKFQLPVFLDSHFIYSFSPVTGPNKLFIRLTEAPTAKVKLLICAYRVQLN
ncbi:M-phase phosphoprotein 8 [Protopterus annectens]|uniref:M-phase phosphoprotein 8 n=1 Tax=Protopterus annectens TaxID=7888 RepID=UPI001CFB7889|nr:M-phase phosphoprotein 8 [Protopterus annectens]